MKYKWVLVFFVLLFTAAPLAAAEDVPQPANVSTSSDTNATGAEAMPPGCPGAENGKCCGACQQRARLTKKPAAEMGGCPCQRARQGSELK